MKKISLAIIRAYQFLFSFDHSFWSPYVPMRVCRFHPSCSEYTYQAIDKYGFLKGSGLGAKRILRCHPFAKGGYDPLQ